MPQRMRAAVIGAVESTALTVKALAESDLDLVGVLGQEPKDVNSVTGFHDLKALSVQLDVPYQGFQKINTSSVVERLNEWQIDYLFVIGLSQLASMEVLSTANRGCIGYHPTALPYGRGRAPVAWLVEKKAPAASTLFEVKPNADGGGILEQVHFVVGPRMDAADVLAECLRTLDIALSRLLPRLEKGEWTPTPQDEDLATYLGRRDGFDGLIDWFSPAEQIDSLIRAAAPPHPGSYFYHGSRRLRVYKSGGVVLGSRYLGIPGKVLRHDGDFLEVQCDPGVLKIGIPIDENEYPVDVPDGALLRTRVEDELHELRAQVAKLTRVVSEISATR